MATWNGPAQNGGRIEYTYTVGSVSRSTTSVTVSVTAYLRMLNGNRSNGSYPQSWSGSWGSGSSTPSYNIARDGRVQIRSWSGSVSLTDSTQSRSFQISAGHYFGTTSATLNVTVPARYARTPTNLQVNRVSDSRIDLSWARQGTYTQTGVQFRHNTGSGWGSWTSAGTATGNVSVYQKTSGIYANRAYQFRVRSSNGHHWSEYTGASGVVYTTPSAPSTVTASRSGSNIVVGVSGLPPHVQSFDIEREGSGIVGSAIAKANMPWTDTGAGTARRRYRVRARQSSGGNNSSVLTSGWSSWSNYSQLLNAPSSVVAARVSDTQITVSWTRNSVYTSVVVQRQTDGGSWVTAGTAQGNASSWSDTGSSANHRYRYRVQGRDDEGGSDWSIVSSYLYTTPAAPTGVSATRVGNNIRVDVSGLGPYATHFDIERDGSGTVGSVVARGSMPWTHVSPDPSQTARYRVRGRVASGGSGSTTLLGPWSAWSNTVQLQSPPNAPTNLGPNGGVVAAGASVRYSWRHNPVDSSEQTQYQLRYRPAGGSWTTLTGTTSSEYRDLPLTAPGSYEWEVRTRGSHATYGPYSATATVTVISVPTVAINTPDSGIWTEPTLTAAWSYVQGEGRPQTGWRVQLTDVAAGGVLVDETGTGARSSYLLPVRLVRSTYYRLRVWVANSGIWSGYDEMSFETVFVPPAAPFVDAFWNEAAGSHDLAIDTSVGPEREDVVNLVTNPRMEATSGTVEVRRNLVNNPIGAGAPTSGSSGWRTITASTGAFTVDGGRPAYEMTQGAAVSAPYIDPNQSFTASVGDTIRFSIDVKTNSESLADSMRLRISSYSDAANDSSTVAVTPIPVNVWTRLSLSGVVTEAPEGGYFRTLVWPRDGADAGDYIRVRRALVEIGTGLLPGTDFFDGSTSPEADLTPSWTGTANGSASVLTGQRVANIASVGTNWASGPYQITEPDGSKAARFITGTTSLIGVPVSNVSTPVGTTRTVLFQVRPSVDITARPRVGNSATSSTETIPAGQWTTLRITAASGATTANTTGLLVSGSTPGNTIDIRYALLSEGEYDGPYFDGSSGQFRIDGSAMNAVWDGAQDGSTSRLKMSEPTIRTVIERSVDGGETWEPVYDAPSVEGELSLSDYEGLSYGTTIYRATGYSVADEASETEWEITARSEAVWINYGDGFSNTVRLPYEVRIEPVAGRDGTDVVYRGRSAGVPYASSFVDNRVVVSGVVFDREIEGSATREELRAAAVAASPSVLYRDPAGHRFPARMQPVQFAPWRHGRPDRAWEWSTTVKEVSR